MSTPSATARRRLRFGLSVLAIAIVLFGGCVWLGGELLRPIPPARTPTPLPTPLGGGGGLIAFESRRDGNSEIYVMNADGTGQRNLTNDSAPLVGRRSRRMASGWCMARVTSHPCRLLVSSPTSHAFRTSTRSTSATPSATPLRSNPSNSPPPGKTSILSGSRKAGRSLGYNPATPKEPV